MKLLVGLVAVGGDVGLRFLFRFLFKMSAADGRQGIFRACQEANSADAGCIGKSADAAGAEKTRGTDPSGVPKRTLRLSWRSAMATQ